jgi:Protein kinase domain
MVGSVHHIAPEQISGRAYSGEKNDIWSLGIILHRMLVGRPPFSNANVQQMFDDISHARFDAPKNVSADALDLMGRLLQVDADRRLPLKRIREHRWLAGVRLPPRLAHYQFAVAHPHRLFARPSDLPLVVQQWSDHCRSVLRRHEIVGVPVSALGSASLSDLPADVAAESPLPPTDILASTPPSRTSPSLVAECLYRLHCHCPTRKLKFILSLESIQGSRSSSSRRRSKRSKSPSLNVVFDLSSGQSWRFFKVVDKLQRALLDVDKPLPVPAPKKSPPTSKRADEMSTMPSSSSSSASSSSSSLSSTTSGKSEPRSIEERMAALEQRVEQQDAIIAKLKAEIKSLQKNK